MKQATWFQSGFNLKSCPIFMAWEMSRRFSSPSLVSPRNDVEQRLQKFHTDDLSLPRSGYLLLVEANFSRKTTIQTHYPDLGICYWSRQISLARWPFRRTTQIWVVTRHQYRISAVAAQIPFRGKIIGNQWWRHEISAFFSGYYFRFAWLIKFRNAKRSDHVRECLGTVKTWTDRRIRHACRSRWIIYKITRALSAHVCVFIL